MTEPNSPGSQHNHIPIPWRRVKIDSSTCSDAPNANNKKGPRMQYSATEIPQVEGLTSMAQAYTVFRTHLVGLLGEQGERLGTESFIRPYHIVSGDPEGACEDIVANLAEHDPRLEDLDQEDDEYESLHATALDDLPGIFSVYEGTLLEAPELPALYKEGFLGEPLYWAKSNAAALA